MIVRAFRWVWGQNALCRLRAGGRATAFLSTVCLLLWPAPSPCPTRPQPRPLPAASPTSVVSLPIALLDNAQAWQHLPPAVCGAGQPLPFWARALARTMPRTTAAMLELDYAHRGQSPLDPLLRGRLRWIAAHSSGCRYSEAYAQADLRRAGLDEAGLRALASDPSQYPEADRAALVFARKLTEDAPSITDAEVAGLIEHYGEKAVVAMALLVAHANFQDRLILSLGLPLDSDGPLPPLNVRFARAPLGSSRAGLPRVRAQGETASVPCQTVRDAEWLALDFDRLQKELASRRVRKPRIDLPPETSGAINWGFVCNRYQPELAAAWTSCAQAFGDEANQDPIFEQLVLWVVSRSSRCYYCLGHTEMVLGVSGLNQEAITQQTQCLASGEWSGFSASEQAAFAFARKTKNPGTIAPDDYQELVRHFGPERALDVVWWTCRCHYMNRVADAFQLTLESENVFDGFRPDSKGLSKGK